MAGLEDLNLLKNAEAVADEVWQMVIAWDAFSRETLGKQWVRAIDSVGANVAEAFGRFYFGEKIRFLYYARGSVFEGKYWLNQAKKRGLVTDEAHRRLASKLTDIAIQLNNFIRNLKQQRQVHGSPQSLKEPAPIYSADDTSLFSDEDPTWLLES